MDRLRELVRYRKSRHLVRVRRAGPGSRYTDGFVVGVSDELVAMYAVCDFKPDGFEVFPLADVEKLVSSERDIFWQSMLEREGVTARRLPMRLQIGDCRALMTSLKGWGKAIGVHYRDGEDDYYAPGVVRTVGEDGFGLHYFSASGVWDDELTTIAYADVLRVDVERPYVDTFERYLVPPDDV